MSREAEGFKRMFVLGCRDKVKMRGRFSNGRQFPGIGRSGTRGGVAAHQPCRDVRLGSGVQDNCGPSASVGVSVAPSFMVYADNDRYQG